MSLPNISRLGLIDPKLASAQLAIRKNARVPHEDQIKAFRALAKPAAQGFDKMVEDWSFFRGKDWKNPANDAALVKLFVGGVEPGLQVTTAEGQTVINAAESDVGAIGQRILRTLTNAGSFTPTTRRLMISSIENGFVDRTGSKLNFFDSLEEEARATIPEEFRGARRSILGIGGSRKKRKEFMDAPINFDAIGPKLDRMSGEDLPEDQAKWVEGVVYKTNAGPATWNAAGGYFEAAQ